MSKSDRHSDLISQLVGKLLALVEEVCNERIQMFFVVSDEVCCGVWDAWTCTWLNRKSRL